MDGLHLQTCLFDQSRHVVAVIHLAVAVGDGGEIQARHGEAEGGRLKALAVPQGLHDVQAAVLIHNLGGTAHDAYNLVFTEAVEELAHPDGVVVLVGGEGLRSIQQVHAIAVDAVGTRLASGGFPHHLQLLRQVHNGHLHVAVEFHALHSPTTCVATYVKQGLRLVGEHDLQGLLERAVAVEMVEAEPALLHLRRQLREALVHRGPRTEVLESDRATFFQAFFEMEPSLVVHVVVELGVHVSGGVGDEAPARLTQRVVVGFGVDEHRANAEARFEHHLGGVATDASFFGYLGFGHAVVAVAEHLKDAEFLHQTAHLEHDGAPSDPFGLGLSLASGQMLLGVGF